MNLFNCPEKNNCGCTEVCGPDKIENNSSLKSIRETLLQIINAVKNIDILGFNVDVDITTINGVLNTINFSKTNINSIELTKTTISYDGLAISLCDIAKITILSSEVSNTPFNAMLLNSIKGIATSCVCLEDLCNDKKYSSYTTEESSCVKCAQGMQNYINQNLSGLKTVGYTGNASKIESITAIDDITKIDVIETVDANTTNKTALTSASLKTTTLPVVKTVSAQDLDIVTSVTTEDATILSNIDNQTVDVCGALTIENATLTETVELSNAQDLVSNVDTTTQTVVTGVQTTPETVATGVDTTPQTVVTTVDTTPQTVVTEVQTTPETVVATVNTTTGTVVTGFTGSSSITGVISGVNTIKNVTPDSVEIPAFACDGTGELVVKIPAKSIDGTNPVSEVEVKVTVNGNNISFNGNTAHYTLADDTKLIGGSTQAPQVSTITTNGTPQTDTFIKTATPQTTEVIKTVTPQTDDVIKTVTPQTDDVIKTVTPQTTEVIKTVTPQTDDVIKTVTPQTTNGKLVTNVTTKDVSVITNQPTTETVISAITPQNTTIKNITDIKTSNTTDLINTTFEDVLATANIETEEDNFISSVTLDTTTASVISDISTIAQNVSINIPEEIEGTPFVAGDGIMGVNNDNGNITVYSICDINSVNN